MTEETAGPTARETWTMRVVLGVSALLLSIGLIAALILKGDPNNALHLSAHSWAWMLVFAVLGAFGFPAITDLIPWKK